MSGPRIAGALRRFSPLDRLLAEADTALRMLAAPAQAARPAPEGADEPQPGLDGPARALSSRLMRINHSGEIAAQALYRGQALLARDPVLREELRQAAGEEHDHLAWCEQRLAALGERPSLFNPLWYAGAFALGAAASLAGDRISLGFLAETERQVEGHITDHLARLPEADGASRAVLARMRDEEAGHGSQAIERGGMPLPAPVRRAMWLSSRVMTALSGWR
jgi:ubiquinone biosynthesis monooxygenase Coq7